MIAAIIGLELVGLHRLVVLFPMAAGAHRADQRGCR